MNAEDKRRANAELEQEIRDLPLVKLPRRTRTAAGHAQPTGYMRISRLPERNR